MSSWNVVNHDKVQIMILLTQYCTDLDAEVLKAQCLFISTVTTVTVLFHAPLFLLLE